MANNLHISYDLNTPGKDYSAVFTAIQSLGAWAKVHKSFWYVRSNYTAEQAAKAVWAVMDASDTVYVADTTNNTAFWFNLPEEVSNQIKSKWHAG